MIQVQFLFVCILFYFFTFFYLLYFFTFFTYLLMCNVWLSALDCIKDGQQATTSSDCPKVGPHKVGCTVSRAALPQSFQFYSRVYHCLPISYISHSNILHFLQFLHAVYTLSYRHQQMKRMSCSVSWRC